jgi:hypothetical protein
MASYYVSVITFNLGEDASTYLIDKKNRITEKTKNSLGDEFWKTYGKVLSEYKKNNKLLFRAKIVKESKVLIKQIWDSKDSRDQFTVDVNENFFNKSVLNLNISRNFMFLNNITEVEKFIDDILLEENKILQHVCDDMKKPGMIIGDPIKGDVLVYV